MIYDGKPAVVGEFKIEVQEFFSYLYLPVKLRGSTRISYEDRLKAIDKLIGAACCDFVGEYGLDRFVDSYVYVTAKNQFQHSKPFNRPGWHSDGFGSNDISYIWSNCQPTVFSNSWFDLCDDDELSMLEMEQQANPQDSYTMPNCSLIRLDRSVIHKVGELERGVRCFVKVVVSKDEFRLQGNSVNYELDYSWEYEPRKSVRNVPQGTLK